MTNMIFNENIFSSLKLSVLSQYFLGFIVLGFLLEQEREGTNLFSKWNIIWLDLAWFLL